MLFSLFHDNNRWYRSQEKESCQEQACWFGIWCHKNRMNQPSTEKNYSCSRQNYQCQHNSGHVHQNIISVIVQQYIAFDFCTKCKITKWTCYGICSCANCHCNNSDYSKSRHTCSLHFCINSNSWHMTLKETPIITYYKQANTDDHCFLFLFASNQRVHLHTTLIIIIVIIIHNYYYNYYKKIIIISSITMHPLPLDSFNIT